MKKFRKIAALLASAFGCAKGGDNSSTQQQSSAAEQSKADQESSQEEKDVKEGNSWEWENGTPVTLSYFYDKLVPTANFDRTMSARRSSRIPASTWNSSSRRITLTANCRF